MEHTVIKCSILICLSGKFIGHPRLGIMSKHCTGLGHCPETRTHQICCLLTYASLDLLQISIVDFLKVCQKSTLNEIMAFDSVICNSHTVSIVSRQ
jgi:hypothetical protein